MKYIRTKDGSILNLIAYKEDGEINGGIKYTSKLNGSYFFIQKDNILKKADTIEECFDEYVYANKKKDTKFRCIPIVAEFRNGKWHSKDDSIGEEKYLNEICKAIAFVDIQEQIIPIENENKDEKMNKELTSLKALNDLIDYLESEHLDLSKEDHVVERKEIIETSLKRLEIVEEENKLLRENNENLDEIYYDTWYACERLKESSDYALMFVDDLYCLVDTKDNKFDVIDSYEINSKGIIDADTKNKLKALEIIKEKQVDVHYLLICIEQNINPLQFYNEYMKEHNALCLTQEEFDLLKKTLIK